MWLSLNIISRMVDLNGISPEEIANRLTMSTAEIECIDYLNSHFNSIVTAKILEINPHPNADKLTLVDLDAGIEKLSVVCGASNHKTGDIVALAKIGTKFNEEFTVKKAKLRGVESSGMLCSEKELGLSEDHSGIMILPEDTKIGRQFDDLYSEWIDTRLEIDNKSITHRPDLWSHRGFAREIGSLFNRPVKEIVDYSLTKSFKSEENLKVTIQNPEAAPRYSGLAIKNISIGESPDWLKASVTSIGMRPINNLVDITNYVMAELGEPMHAFDKTKLKGDEIIVRMAKKDEILKTLDGQEHKLTTEDIVIADKGGAIALAGVMGGGNSEIDDDTSIIVLEAANFNPINIRKTAQRFDMRTEAATRFEKSLTPELTSPALIRCYELIKQIIPEAEAVTEIIDAYPAKPEKITIETSTEYIRKKLGQDISDEKIIDIISSLDFKIKNSDGSLEIAVPHYRATKDISIPADIVEEVGRIFGYDNISPKAPYVPCNPPEINKFRSFERNIRNILSYNFNMTEVSGYSFVGEDTLNRLKINDDKELRLRNPLSQDYDRLRRSLVQNIVKNIELNQRYHDEFYIYELGRVYLKDDRKSSDLIKENTRVTGAVYDKKPENPLFYDAKNIVSGLIKDLNINDVQLVPENNNLPVYSHPGRSMEIIIQGKTAGLIFELNPDTIEAFELNGSAAIFDIDLDLVYKSDKADNEFIDLQKFPEVPFEISVIADKHTYSNDICSIIEDSEKKYIQSVNVISIYEGNPIPDGKKSISIKVIFADKDKTLEPGEIDRMQKKVISDLNKKGYSLR